MKNCSFSKLNLLKVLYNLWIISTILAVIIYYAINRSNFAAYFPSILFYIIFSILLLFVKNRRISYFFITLPISFLTVSLFLKTHIFPEMMILGINRMLLTALNIFPSKDIKIPNVIKLVYFNLIIFFLLFEGVLTLIYAVKPMDVMKRQIDIFRLSPNSTFNNSRVNQDGYMGMDIKRVKTQKRFLFIGDSFGVGIVDYKKNFIQLLDDSLDIETINLSQPGFSPSDYLNQLEKYYDEVLPDNVIIIIFAGNDITSSYVPENNYAFENLKSVSLVKNIIALSNVKNEKYVSGGGMLLSHEIYLRIEKERARILTEGSYKREWRDFENKIDKINGFCVSKNVYLTFLVIPDEYSVNTEIQDELKNEGSDYEDWIKTTKRISEYLNIKNIDYIDMTAYFKTAFENGETIYKKDDTHINEEGNRIIFEILKNKILQNR